MELENRKIIVYVSSEGFQQLGSLLDLESAQVGRVALVTGTDNFGIGLSLAGERWLKNLIVPWHYLRALEIEPQMGRPKDIKKSVGFRP